MTLLTTDQVARLIGASPRTVRRLAIEHGLGQRIGRDRLFSAADAAALSKKFRGKSGNPNWVPGHDLGGRPPKKSRNSPPKLLTGRGR